MACPSVWYLWHSSFSIIWYKWASLNLLLMYFLCGSYTPLLGFFGTFITTTVKLLYEMKYWYNDLEMGDYLLCKINIKCFVDIEGEGMGGGRGWRGNGRMGFEVFLKKFTCNIENINSIISSLTAVNIYMYLDPLNATSRIYMECTIPHFVLVNIDPGSMCCILVAIFQTIMTLSIFFLFSADT